ncbi:MAG: hypothetical protein ACREM8_10575 [Vulcanimicrobiaceae bacterium]
MNTLTEAQRQRVLALMREGKTLRQIERETGHRRETIAAYGRRRGLLRSVGIEFDAEPAQGQLCEPHRATIVAALDVGATLRAIHVELIENYGFTGSYSTLKRYVRTKLVSTRDTTMLLAA